MNLISNILYWISTGLLVPVIVLLIFLFIRAIFLIGSFFGQYMAERRTSAVLDAASRTLCPSGVSAFVDAMPAKGATPVVGFIRQIFEVRDNAARMDYLVSEFELQSEKNIASSKVLTKMGPILGLMGTLIPMGPALVGLAAGDIASMAYNMQVAFATTVVGLVVSAVGFITQQARERWALHSLMLLEFFVQTLKDGGKDEK